MKTNKPVIQKANKLKRLIVVVFLGLMASWIYGFADDVGREVDITLPLNSVVCLSPAHTEMIFWLGAEEKLVAVSTSCDYPEEAKELPKAGTFLNPDVEKIVSLNPGAVFSGGGIQKKAIFALHKLGVPVAVYYPTSVEGIIEDMESISEILGLGKDGDNKIQGFKQELKKIKMKSFFKKKPKVYIELWNDPPMGVGKGSFINEIVKYAGGINILSDSLSEYPKISKEEIIKRNPDIVILLYPGDEKAKNRDYIKLTNAGKNNKVYVLDEKELDVMMRPGPRITKAIKIVSDIINESRLK